MSSSAGRIGELVFLEENERLVGFRTGRWRVDREGNKGRDGGFFFRVSTCYVADQLVLDSARVPSKASVPKKVLFVSNSANP
jgi:hypothetical protein